MKVNYLICLGLSCLLSFVGPMAFLVLCWLKRKIYSRPFFYGAVFSVVFRVFVVVFVQNFCSIFLKSEPVLICVLSEFVGVTICEIGRIVAMILAKRNNWFIFGFFELIAFTMGYFSGKSVLLDGVLNWLNFFEVVSSTANGSVVSGNVLVLSLFSEFISSFKLVVEILLTLMVAMFFYFDRINLRFLCVCCFVLVHVIFSGLKFVLSLVFNLGPFVVQSYILFCCLICFFAVIKLKTLVNRLT